jgi:hypothetical protein
VRSREPTERADLRNPVNGKEEATAATTPDTDRTALIEETSEILLEKLNYALTPPAPPRFLDDFDPELEREVFAFRPAKLWPELLDVTRAKHVDIESWPSRNCSDIGAVSVVVPDDLGQNQIVPFENAELKFSRMRHRERW